MLTGVVEGRDAGRREELCDRERLRRQGDPWQRHRAEVALDVPHQGVAHRLVVEHATADDLLADAAVAVGAEQQPDVRHDAACRRRAPGSRGRRGSAVGHGRCRGPRGSATHRSSPLRSWPHPAKRRHRTPAAVHRGASGHRSERIHAHRTAPRPRRAARGSTTDGTSRAEWYAAYGTLPRRTAGMPAASNDTWSLARLVHPLVATPAARDAARIAVGEARGAAAAVSTRAPSPTAPRPGRARPCRAPRAARPRRARRRSAASRTHTSCRCRRAPPRRRTRRSARAARPAAAGPSARARS